MSEPDLKAFIEALPKASIAHRVEGLPESFRRKFRHEIFLLFDMLYNVGLVGADCDVYADEAETCDVCDCELTDHRWFIDGAVQAGGWANMCPTCFISNGKAIGYGSGQLYVQTDDGRWRLVSGGNPNALP